MCSNTCKTRMHGNSRAVRCVSSAAVTITSTCIQVHMLHAEQAVSFQCMHIACSYTCSTLGACRTAGLQELNDRAKFLQVLLEKYQQANQEGTADAVAEISTSSSSKQGSVANAVSGGPPLLPEEAVAVIIRNERGRQVRCVAVTAAVTRCNIPC
eukprot:GHRQ01020813.1.p1 GENE.GHRQ01020813.1~~GHRQ01020813.1.p1  ORF type:complete len:155 (+),score=47.73 GHRQ01020813.1:350-814(+)